MAVAALSRMAERAPVPVFALAGPGMQREIENLSLDPHVEMATSPRHASVLLVAGDIPHKLHEAVCRLHDQLPHPRTSLWWDAVAPRKNRSAHQCVSPARPAAALRDLYRRLLRGDIVSEVALLPDSPPAPWRGKGDHGQGGEGMMGGKPYGRPMAMTNEDIRDGLNLDAYQVRIGPFAPMLPPGLCLDLTLQGDVVQDVRVAGLPFPDEPPSFSTSSAITVAEIERLRLAACLRNLARFLRCQNLSALSARCLRYARGAEDGELPPMILLRRWIMVSGALNVVPEGIGRLSRRSAAKLGGHAARASGTAVDARAELDAWPPGFHTITREASDVRARVGAWLDQAVQSHALASQPSTATNTVDRRTAERVVQDEAREGATFTGGTDSEFPALLKGLAWDELVAVIASFDTRTLRRLLPEPGE